MFIIGMRYDGFDDQLEVLRHTSALVFQLESVSSVCGRTTYFALGQSRQNRPEASQNFHVTKAGPRTPWLPPAIVWIGAFPGGHNPSRLRFRSKAFRRLTVYSRRNALSLRQGVSIGKLPSLKAACRPIPKASPARGGEVPSPTPQSLPPQREDSRPRGRQEDILTSRIPPCPTSRHIPLPPSAEGGGPLAKGEWCRINSPADPPAVHSNNFLHISTRKREHAPLHTPLLLYISPITP